MSRIEEFKHNTFDDKFSTLKGNVLEIGCGIGKNFHLYPHGCHVTALELSFSKVAKAKATAHQRSPKPIVINADAQQLPLPSDYYDVIIVSMVLCAVGDVEQTLRELNRVAKTKAHLLLFEHIRFANPILSTLQHTLSPVHAFLLGCHLNRNPIDLVSQYFAVTQSEVKNGVVPWLFVEGYKK